VTVTVSAAISGGSGSGGITGSSGGGTNPAPAH
jgi:hypothetical protein